MSIRKKKLLVLLLSFSLVVSVSFNIFQLIRAEPFEKDTSDSYSKAYLYLNSITYSRFSTMIESGESFAAYIGRPDCSDCQDIDSILIDTIAERGLTEKILYFNIADIRADASAWEKFKINYQIKYTPTFVYYENGKMKYICEWTPEKGINIAEVKLWMDQISLVTATSTHPTVNADEGSFKSGSDSAYGRINLYDGYVFPDGEEAIDSFTLDQPQQYFGRQHRLSVELAAFTRLSCCGTIAGRGMRQLC